ncbi:MAG: bifunctional nicotinamidase/pyrazinamidase [Gammaproteobacteria bacterium]|nr:bifunctional nicotinamidase/pyrazinamidase [Gammaproteobacteria bacterium]
MIDHSTDCLLVIDVQNDFCVGGALAVPDGDAVVGVINQLHGKFQHRLLTQDWHPAEHQSFASSHKGKSPMEVIEVDYGSQVLWPDHCVQGSAGAAFHPQLNTIGAELVLRKGFRAAIDSYSAFFENDKTTATGLSGYLRTRNFSRLFMVGLATDFCVAYSAIDACSEGFTVFLVEDACRAIDFNGSLQQAFDEMDATGVQRIESASL